MKLELARTDNTSPHVSLEYWRGELNGKEFEVMIDSCAAPQWSATTALDWDERNEILAAIERQAV